MPFDDGAPLNLEHPVRNDVGFSIRMVFGVCVLICAEN